MAANEIQNVDDAKKRIVLYFGDIPNIDGYASMAAFLSDREQVAKALMITSAGIWDEYRKDYYVGTINRFTRSILRYALKFGFRCQDNVVFTGPLTSSDFLNQVANGNLWKDTFAPEHGEFSHTFQWLATGHHLNWGSDTAMLYKNCADKFNIQPLWSREGRGWKKMPAGEVSFWSWLVDCFPAPRGDKFESSTDHIASDSCRTPNIITALVRNELSQQDCFIRMYVDYRQDSTINRASQEGKADEVYEVFQTNPEARKTNIQAIKSLRTQHYMKEGTRTWKGSGPLETIHRKSISSPDPSLIEDRAYRIFSRSVELNRPWQKTMRNVTFHNEPGLVPDAVYSHCICK